MSEWQPIETAPRDGTPVILLYEDGAIEGEWRDSAYRPGWHPISLNSHGCKCCATDDDPPSHWIPKPEPPK